MLNFNQKKMLAAYERFYGDKYITNFEETGNTEMHIATQKMCYLLKVAGVEIGDFDYSWNFRGPFSPGLLALLRSMDRRNLDVIDFYAENSGKDIFLSNIATKIDELRKKLEIDKHQKEYVRWMEILGSLTYISRVILPGADFEEVNQRLIQEKAEYRDKNINHHAWDLLNEANLLSEVNAC